MEAFNLTDALSRYIVGQKRTSPHKQFVFLCGNEVIKGPFKQDKLNNVMSRSNILKNWNSPVAVLATESFETPEGTFIKYPNFMKVYTLETEEHSESFSDYKYNIIKNAPVITIGNAIPNNDWIFPNIEDTLLTLCHLNILGVGDSNVRNSLIDPNTKKFYVIDFDENLGSDRDDEVFYYNKLPAKKYNWYDNCKQHYNKVADRLIPLLNDDIVISNKLEERVKRVIRLLRQYGLNKIITESKREIKPLILRLNIKSDIPNIKPPIPKFTNKPINNLGKMVWKGLLGGSKTFSGLDLDIAKSAVQKYIRRNMVDKALMAAIEMYKFIEIPEGKAAVTNLFNRVMIASNEDVGPANVDLVCAVTEFVESGNRDIGLLLTMIKLLCESKKTRLPSHCWRSYAHPDGREVALGLGLPLDIDFTSEDLKFIKENNDCDIFLPSDPQNIRCYILMFWDRLVKKDFNAFTWVSWYIDASKDLMLTKRKKFILSNTRSITGKADILIWKVLAKVLPNQTCDILCDAYFNHTESRPFLQNAIVIALYGLPYNKLDIVVDITIDVENLLKCEISLEVDSFVIDKHTRQGKILGKTVQTFVDEGAYVSLEDMDYHNELLAKIYCIR